MRLIDLASRPTQGAGRVALLLAASLAVGCQTFAPTGLGNLVAKQKEQKIVKQAANDPFPSPKDVGLGGNDKAKSL